ncbi:MAG: hypothetical protein QOK17_901 [Sphingomonadales bacterium]|nr:hypothetical protein [Sphingomonadales bacterium]
MINNRQNGRRRGRGGGPRSPNQGPNPGNRQDNRSRGNAAQLLEKYKALARDAQMAGDRVQTEYWLQFADHYFRVLNESRARFEEQRPRRDDYSDEDEGDESGINVAVDAEERDDREEREDRGERQDRGYRDRGDRVERVERPRREYGADRNGEPRPERRPRDDRHDRDDRDDEAAESGERISLEVLPPAISVVESDAPPKPARRRTRRPRDEDGEEIAPAA